MRFHKAFCYLAIRYCKTSMLPALKKIDTGYITHISVKSIIFLLAQVMMMIIIVKARVFII